MSVIGLVMLFGGVYYRTLPGVSDAEARVGRQVSNGLGAETGSLPPRLSWAIVATEDRRFYDHGAIDVQGVLRAAWTTISLQGVDPGGSTITQQLAKLVYPDTGALGPLHAVGVALKLERRYSKREILEMYLSSVYFGDGAYGAAAAARRYYGRVASRLSWSQASMLAGLLQAPSALDPRLHFAAARRRQCVVLSALVRAGRLSNVHAARIFADAEAARPVA